MKIKKIRVLIVFLLFVAYFFLAARPIPPEIVLTFAWVNSLSNIFQADGIALQENLAPFTLGNRFGYVDFMSGQFGINRIKTDNIYLDGYFWTEYETQPTSIVINNLFDESIINIEGIRGYPILLDNRIFILGSEQNELSEIDLNGNILWTYEYGAPLTCVDAAAGLVLTGSLDGVVEILNSRGERIYYFKPGGSKYEVIFGCAVSANGSRIAVICGLDQQRFLFIERSDVSGGEYRVIHHEFLDMGFRRPIRILFIDDDNRIVFERAGGLSCFNIKSRSTFFIPLKESIAAIDGSGDSGLLFLITSDSGRHNELIGINLPEDRRFSFNRNNDTENSIFLKASFYSNDVFLGRTGSKLVVGGGTALISFDLERK